MIAAKSAPDSSLKPTATDLQRSFMRHLQYTLVKDKYSATTADLYLALAFAVRDMLAERWLDTQQSYYINDAKRVYYISMEFLMGRTLGNSLINLGVMEEWENALMEMGIDLKDIAETEWDAGLGNGGLGRLAACFLDSMATMSLPAYGYGIRYEYGMFYQKIIDGAQYEVPDNWLRYEYPWEFGRQEHLHKIRYEGRVEENHDTDGEKRHTWADTHDVMALAYDVPVPGYGNQTVNTMRLWSAKSTREFELESFNRGNYVGAVESKMKTENISKVLYPADHMAEGKELRLRQEYFLASATVQDIFYRFAKKHDDLCCCPKRWPSNSTTPTLPWPSRSWCGSWLTRSGCPGKRPGTSPSGRSPTPTTPSCPRPWKSGRCACWRNPAAPPADHLRDQRPFPQGGRARFPGDSDRLRRMSIVEEEGEKHIRMAHLAIVGSHSINGVSVLHRELLRNSLFRDFFALWPERFNNKTNGITQRRWLKYANPWLVGPDHLRDRGRLDHRPDGVEQTREMRFDRKFKR